MGQRLAALVQTRPALGKDDNYTLGSRMEEEYDQFPYQYDQFPTRSRTATTVCCVNGDNGLRTPYRSHYTAVTLATDGTFRLLTQHVH